MPDGRFPARVHRDPRRSSGRRGWHAGRLRGAVPPTSLLRAGTAEADPGNWASLVFTALVDDSCGAHTGRDGPQPWSRSIQTGLGGLRRRAPGGGRRPAATGRSGCPGSRALHHPAARPVILEVSPGFADTWVDRQGGEHRRKRVAIGVHLVDVVPSKGRQPTSHAGLLAVLLAEDVAHPLDPVLRVVGMTTPFGPTVMI